MSVPGIHRYAGEYRAAITGPTQDLVLSSTTGMLTNAIVLMSTELIFLDKLLLAMSI